MEWMKLSVLTYNIHRAIGVDRRFRMERIVEVLGHHDADLVLLQEVDEGAPRSRELDLAREIAQAAGYPHWAVGHNVSLRKGRYGNATLSRFPIERERNIDLTIGAHKRRGCQHTTIAIGGRDPGGGGPVKPRTLEVFNLHLGLSASERQAQVHRLLLSNEWEELGADAPCLVGGDFNDWRSRLLPIFTVALGFGCATQLAGGGRCMRTYPSFSPRGALDRLYYRGPLRPLDVRTSRLDVVRVASDHLPVVAEFELD
jgi:endonuclease/exonuclease/phosphatase family metal-dependent hydrolase